MPDNDLRSVSDVPERRPVFGPAPGWLLCVLLGAASCANITSEEFGGIVALRLLEGGFVSGATSGLTLLQPEASDEFVTGISVGVMLRDRYAFTLGYSWLVADSSDYDYDFERLSVEADARGWGGFAASASLVPHVTMLDGPDDGWRGGFGAGLGASYVYFGFRIGARVEWLVFTERVESGSASGCWDKMTAASLLTSYEYKF
jgi:hypothetical protein